MLRLKQVAVLLLPPIVTAALQRLLRRGRGGAADDGGMTAMPLRAALAEWEMVPRERWPEAGGWDHASIAETQVAKWPDFIDSLQPPRPFGVSHEAPTGGPVDIGPHNTTMTFAYVLGRLLAEAPTGGAAPSVLDWGGGLGHYAAIAARLYPHATFDYVVKDLDALATAGRKVLPDVTFVSSDAEALSRRYDLIYASSSLHYSRDVYGCLAGLCDSADRWLMVTRTPFVEDSDDFVVIQRPHRYGYHTEYAGWFLNRRKFVDFVTARGFRLEREFLLDERPVVPNAPEQCRYRGFLFERTTPNPDA